MISCVILTKNSSKTIKQTLDSISSLEEVIIYDNGSTDNTIEIAKNYPNVKIHIGIFEGFGNMRNKAALLAKNNWILALDSDEVLSHDLAQELKHCLLDERFIYSFKFHNFFNNKQIKCCGWYPESHVRLYNREITSFSPDFVHEKVIEKNLDVKSFKFPINHCSYLCIDDFLIKMSKYSSLFAKQNKGKKKASTFTAIFHSIYAFFKSYILKKGMFYGKEGFIISIYNANTALYKYLKLQEINQK